MSQGTREAADLQGQGAVGQGGHDFASLIEFLVLS